MTSIHIRRLITLAEELETKLDQSPMTGDKSNYNQQFHAQREMLSKFYDFFYGRLRHILTQMESDIGTLRQRGFDSNMRHLFIQVYRRLEDISKKIDETKPYTAARQLVEYVGDRHHRSIIDNLQFLAEQHLENTKPEIADLPIGIRHIVMAESLPMVKELAERLKEHMDRFPLIAQAPTTPIPPRLTPAAEHPAQPVGEQQATNPAIPKAKLGL